MLDLLGFALETGGLAFCGKPPGRSLLRSPVPVLRCSKPERRRGQRRCGRAAQLLEQPPRGRYGQPAIATPPGRWLALDDRGSAGEPRWASGDEIAPNRAATRGEDLGGARGRPGAFRGGGRLRPHTRGSWAQDRCGAVEATFRLSGACGVI